MSETTTAATALKWLRAPKPRTPHIMETSPRLVAEFLIISDYEQNGTPLGPDRAGHVAFCGYGGNVRGWIWNITTLVERGWVSEVLTQFGGTRYVVTPAGREMYYRLPEHVRQAGERYKTAWHMWG